MFCPWLPSAPSNLAQAAKRLCCTSWRLRRACLVLFCSLGLLAFLAGCSSKDSDNAKQANKPETECVPVETAPASQQDLAETISAVGTLEAVQAVQIRPEVAGLVRQVHFQEGQRVEKNELLFSLEDAKIQERFKARQAALEEARAELENARRTFKRRQRLFEKNLGTEESRDAAETALQAAKARVDRLLAEIGEIRETLQDTRIKAPFAGFLGERQVDSGDWVDVGTPLVSLVDPERLKTSFTVPERHGKRVQEGQSIRVTTPSHPEREFPGEVYFVSPQIEVRTRKLLVKAYVDNEKLILRPGGFASVELKVKTRRNAVVIPEEALIPTRSGYQVFVVRDERAESRTVSIGLRKPGIVEIKNGLQAKEQVISAGHISVQEGARVCESKTDGSS